MANNISEKRIEIDGEDYTLFLNRKGIASWENITKFSKKIKELNKKYEETVEKIDDKPIEVEDNSNPFDYSDTNEIQDLEKDEQELRDIYVKWYWIALYTNHKLTLSEVNDLFTKAEEEYGIEQLIELANKMTEQANKNQNANLKKLEALNQTK